MTSFRHILVPIDFSDTSADALNHAISLAWWFESTLHLLHVVENPHLVFTGAELWSVSEPELRQRLEQSALERLAPLASEHEPALTIMRTVRFGRPSQEIVDHAEEHDIDLIVIGTHGRGVVPHALLGSVAEKVVRMARSPVLTVRHAQRDVVVA